MYEQKNNFNKDIKLFGIKIYERVDDLIRIFDHEFVNDEEEQTAIAERETTVCKFFGIPIIKGQQGFDPQNLIPKEDSKFKFDLPPMNKLLKCVLIILGIVITLLAIFTAGIYIANTEWFNDSFYIKSRQMENLEIKSLKPYNYALFKKAYSQAELNEASQARYEHYHEYFNKVVARIHELELEDTEKIVLEAYLNGYDERKEVMKYLLFPRIESSIEDGGYGTLIGSVYPTAMLEFDRQELLTYRMILKNMYAIYGVDSVDYLFEE